MSSALHGRVVVVTRPERQAGSFLQMLRAVGAAPVAFPVLVIQPVVLEPGARSRLGPDDFDWVIYASANAVEQGLAQLPRPRRARLATVGTATARALERHGLEVRAVPATTQDSEGLLAHPEFTEVRGRRVLILRGVGGREVLRQALAARGAEVEVAELYRRVVAAPDAGALETLARACACRQAIVAVTSVEVLDALLEIAPDATLTTLRDAGLPVPGPRVAAAARARGWRGPLVVARSAEDAAMLEALLALPGAAGSPVPA